MQKQIVVFLCLIVSISTGDLIADDAKRTGKLSFGWANESIVPNKPVAIGGQYHTRISGEVHDPLTVTALAIETRDERGVIDQAVWVSCDLVGIRRKTVENVRALVAKSIPDLNVQKIVVSATHTHTRSAMKAKKPTSSARV